MIATAAIMVATSSGNDVLSDGLESGLNAISPKDVAGGRITPIERCGLNCLF